MQLSLKWVNELLNIDGVELDNLIEKLTLSGFEVEEILELEINHKKHLVLDISATANRSDSLSIQGLSTEISAILNCPINIANYSLKIKDWTQNIEKLTKISAIENHCSIFSSIIIENLTNIIVPKWISEKLISSGIIPSNNL